MRQHERSRAWTGDLGAGLLTAAVLWGLLLAGGGIWEHVGGSDLHAHFLPRYIESARAVVREGRLPLWNPNQFCGSPLFAQAQGLSLYLPVLVLFSVLSPYWALQGLYGINLLVLSWGIMAYLRHHGFSRIAGAFGTWAAVAGIFSTPAGVAIDHPNFLASIVWVPWILLCWERAVRDGVRPWLGLAGLACGAQWLGGYPDFSMDTAVLLGVMAIVAGDATLARRATLAAAAVLLGAGLAAILLLPLAEAVGQSVRAVAESNFVNTRAFFALGRTGMWREQLFGHFGSGLAVVTLAALGLARPTRARLAWLAAAGWAAFALDPPFGLLYSVPPFRSVRYPFGWSHILPVFIGFLAASGLTTLLRTGRPVFRTFAVALLLAGAARSATTVWRAPTHHGYRAPDYSLLAERRAELDRILASLPTRPRVFSALEMNSGTEIRDRLRSAAGYDPTMPPRAPRRLIDAINVAPGIQGSTLLVRRAPRLARLLGIGLVTIAPAQVPAFKRDGFRVVGSLPPDNAVVYQDPVPRVRLVNDVLIASDDEAMFQRTIDPARDLVATAVVLSDDAGAVADVRPAPAAQPTVRLVGDLPEHVQMEAVTPIPTLLVLDDTYYPGWQARLDGVEVPILRADYAFRGVVVPPGTHHVDFDYRPASLRRGAAISLVALLVVAALVVPRRRSPRAGIPTGMADQTL